MRRDHLRVCGADRHRRRTVPQLPGSSPRVRSRRCHRSGNQPHPGIISACAEQTSSYPPSREVCGDHLRVCGADFITSSSLIPKPGSSPRVRSRPAALYCQVAYRGIISACAEQTTGSDYTHLFSGDHLRVCGADHSSHDPKPRMVGSSPRVRSRPLARLLVLPPVGIISACAEQTWFLSCNCCLSWDHLRVCGADSRSLIGILVSSGSSPRVRSRPQRGGRLRVRLGIISACAEQTEWPKRVCKISGDHLRVCGADHGVVNVTFAVRGSSPRVRSRLFQPSAPIHKHGIISACAEQTPRSGRRPPRRWDHLRVCGADIAEALGMTLLSGSSPRVRSRLDCG